MTCPQFRLYLCAIFQTGWILLTGRLEDYQDWQTVAPEEVGSTQKIFKIHNQKLLPSCVCVDNTV